MVDDVETKPPEKKSYILHGGKTSRISEIYVFDDGYVPVPNGKYLLQVESINDGSEKYGKVWEFYFLVLEGEHEGTSVKDFVSKKCLSIRSKIGRYYWRLTGIKPYKGKEFSTEEIAQDLIGKECYGHITLEEEYENGKKKLINKVTRIEPKEKKGHKEPEPDTTGESYQYSECESADEDIEKLF